jgi:hypothetical protein
VCALVAVPALAKVKSNNVTFTADVTVNDTLVEKGTYKVTFDDESQELKIMKGSKVVAQTKASLNELKRNGRYQYVYDTLKDASGTTLLSSVKLGGQYAVITNEKIAQARSSQNIQ